MIISGSWIFGGEGASKLEVLAHSMRQVILKDYQKNVKGPVDSFSPFMCHGHQRELLSPLCLNRKWELIIEDKNELAIIEKAYQVKDASLYGQKLIKCLPLDDIQTKIFKEAVGLLSESCETFKERFKTLVICLIPITPELDKECSRGAGNSSAMAKGAIFLGCPTQKDFKELQLGVNLAHELGHQALMVYQSSDTILKDYKRPVYSGVRKEDRPAIQALHGLVALSYMIEFLSKLLKKEVLSPKEKEYAQNTLQELTPSYQTAFKEFSKEDFTEIGMAIYDDLKLFHEVLNGDQ